ncbi:MAG: Sapep family Mn(2+)-dependent dipeptidase [Ancrocorticia sp.]
MSVTTRSPSTVSLSEQAFLASVDVWLNDHRTEFVADLLDWVSIPSVSDEEHAAQGAPFGPQVARMLDRVRERATELGFESSTHEGYAVTILGDPAPSVNDDGASPGSTPRTSDTQPALGTLTTLGNTPPAASGTRHATPGSTQQPITNSEHATTNSRHASDTPATPTQPEIGLVSHLDVVPAGDGWTLDPYTPFEREGFVVGRGSSDNKGPAVVDLYLLRLFRDLGIPLRHRLRVIYGGSEESGMADISYYAKHGPVPGFSLVTDGPFPVNFAQKGGLNLYLHLPTGPVLKSLTGGVAINAVPSSAQVLLGDAHPAAIRAKLAELPADIRDDLDVVAGPDGTELHARGRSGHAAFPGGTRNAVLVLARALVEAELVRNGDLAAARFLATVLATPYGDGSGVAFEDEISGQLTQNGGLVRPEGDGIALHIDIRYPVTASSETIRDRFRDLLAPIGGSLVGYDDAPPFYINPDSPVVGILQDVFTGVSGIDSPPFAMGGGTHSRVLPNAITFGPGFAHLRNSGDDGAAPHPSFIPSGHGSPHGPDEFVWLDDLFTAFRIYALALLRLDKELDHE